MPKYKVAVLPAGYSGCAFWRIRNPLELLAKKHPDMEINILNPDLMDKRRLVDVPRESDLVVLQSPGSEIALDLIGVYKGMNKPIAVDYDDYSFDASPYNPRYKDLGLKEVKAKDADGNEKWVWRDGFGGFDLKANISRYSHFISTCKAVDAVTVTTEYLKSKFVQYGRTDILPNSIDFRKWVYRPKPDKFKDQIRIGWFGGDSHYKDLEMVSGCLGEVMKKYPKARMVLFTPQQWPQLFGSLPQDRVEYHGWADLQFYPLVLSCMFWDIGMVPIEVNEFDKCKSNIKWLEYGALKVPSVMTDSLPYSTDVTDGVNGLLRSNENFADGLSKLLDDDELRLSMGQKAFDYAKTNYNLWDNCTKWYNLYKDLIENTRSCEKKSVVQSQNLANK